MAVDRWLTASSGKWEDVKNWSQGEPTATSDVSIAAEENGAKYTVSLSSAVQVNSLDIASADATFSESASGSLKCSQFEIDSGKAVLRAANAMTSVFMFGGSLLVGNSLALGNGSVTYAGGSLVAIDDVSLADPFTFDSAPTIAAAHGKTLNFTGALAWFGSDSFFGSPSRDGTVVLNAESTGSIIGTQVRGGTLALGTGSNGTGLGTNVQIDKGATLDIGNFNETFVLNGSGTLTDTVINATATLSGGFFDGLITGMLGIDIQGSVTLKGHNTYTGGTIVLGGAVFELQGSVKGAILDEGTISFDAPGVIHNAISGGGAVHYGTDTRIDRTESYSGTTTITDGTIKVGNGKAFGTGDLVLLDLDRTSAPELLATDSITIKAQQMELSSGTTIAAAHAETLRLVATSELIIAQGAGNRLVFGQGNNDGTVVLSDPGNMLSAGVIGALEVAAGTLRIGSSVASVALEGTKTIVDNAATLDLNGFSTDLDDLTGSGVVLDRNGEIVLSAASFSGSIQGSASVFVTGTAFFSGANTYTGGTTIETNGVLILGNRGAIAGSIDDLGVFVIDRSNNFTETNLISGTGKLVQHGRGVTTIDRFESFTGGTAIDAGVLSVDRGAAIGTGQLTLAGGELLVTRNASFANTVDLAGGTIAAANGTTATFSASLLQIGSGAVVFGDATHAGTIDWTANGGVMSSLTVDATVEVFSGTLKDDGASLGAYLAIAKSTTVDAGAKLNLVHQQVLIANLDGAGTVTGAADAMLTLENGNFSGALNGAMAVQIAGDVTLSGPLNTTGIVEVGLNDRLVLNEATAHDILFNVSLSPAGPAQGPHADLTVVKDATLVLTQSDSFTGTIEGFLDGATIDLRDFAFNSNITKHFNHSTDILTLSDGTHSVDIAFDSDFQAKNFHLAQDAHGGTDIIAQGLPTNEAPAHFELG